MSFRIVDLPEPLAPRITFVCPGSSVKLTSFNTTLSSNASDTLSTTTTGWSWGCPALANVAVPEVSTLILAYSSVISNRVTKKSTAITATDDATTALVVARPTPCVPPLVRNPTWQPIVTMTYPRQNGLIMPIHASSRYSPSMTEVQYTLDATRSWKTAMSHPAEDARRCSR